MLRCLIKMDSSNAKKLKDDFKMSDKQYWWIRIKALCHTSNYQELEK